MSTRPGRRMEGWIIPSWFAIGALYVYGGDLLRWLTG